MSEPIEIEIVYAEPMTPLATFVGIVRAIPLEQKKATPLPRKSGASTIDKPEPSV